MPPHAADTAVRFDAILDAAATRGVTILDEHIVQLQQEMRSPKVGYDAAQQLLASDHKFSAVFAFNDISAIGAIRAFTDAGLQRRHRLTAANSINVGRLLPQVAYHAAGSLWHWRKHDTPAGSIVPSGNLGNGMACVWARAMGMPIREIVLAVNANRTIPEYLATGQWQPRPSVATLASALCLMWAFGRRVRLAGRHAAAEQEHPEAEPLPSLISTHP